MLTHEYEKEIKEVANKSLCIPDHLKEETANAAIDWASAKAVQLMSGRTYANNMFKDIHNKYDSNVIGMALDLLDIVNE